MANSSKSSKSKPVSAPKASDVTAIIEQLLEEPWNADDLVPPLSKADKAAVRAAMLERTSDDPTSGSVGVLGQFGDDEVIAALEAVLANEEADADVHEAVPEALATIGTPRAQAALLKLIDHEDTSVARVAIENLPGTPASVVELLLPRFDELAARGDDLLTLGVVEKLVEHAPTNQDVIAVLARNWDVSLRHDTALMASNAIFDALVEHAPTSPVAQAAFTAATAHANQYGQVRGHAALAITGAPLTVHVAALLAIKSPLPSTSSLRKSALASIVAKRRAELAKLAKAGDKAAAKALAKS